MTQKLLLRTFSTLAAVGFIWSVHADESDTPNSAYTPPTGFGGYAWNAPLREFHRLVPEPVYVRIAHFDGETTDFDFVCIQEGGSPSDCSKIAGSGFHAMAEYYVDSQGFRLTDDDGKGKSVLFPITYQFCAEWDGITIDVGGDMLQRMRLCGVRLQFHSETAVQEQSIRDPDYVTSSQRVLNWLIDKHGAPAGFVRRGSIRIEGSDLKREIAPRKSRYDNWFWCPPKSDEVTPGCNASVVFTFDSETGLGQVILLTRPVWAYAYARQYGGSEGDPLYRILHGGAVAPVRHVCTGALICDPPTPRPMSEKMMARFRLPTNAAADSPKSDASAR